MGIGLRRTACLAGLAALLACGSAWAGQSVTYQANPQHTGAVDDTLAPPLGIRWALNMGAPSSYPIVAGGKVFVTTKTTASGYGSTLYALDARTGAIAWSRPLAHTYYWSALAYDGGRLFALDYDGVLQAFTADSGAALWGKQLPGQYSFSSAPVATSGVVYTGGAGSGGTVYAVRESDGQLLWTGSVENGDDSSPAVDGAHMYVSYACSQAYSFPIAGGAPAWHHSTGCEGGGGKTPVLYDGKLYIRDAGGPNLILDASSGSEIGAFGSNVAPAFSAGVGLYMAGGTLAAERTSDRTPMWSFRGDGGLVSAPFVVGSTVYEGSSTGGLFALDRATGTPVWSDCLPGPVAPPDEQNVSQPITGLGAGDGLLVVPAGSWLVAYESRAGAPSYACSPSGAFQVTPAGGGAAGGGGPSGAGTAQPAAVTLSASRHDIHFGQSVTLRGKAAPGATVTLQSDPFPYGSFATRKTATAAGDGSFSFRVKPDRNTAYRATVGASQSGATVVYSDARVTIVRKLSRDRGTLRLAVSATGPADIPLRGHMVHFYYGHKGAKRLRHVAARRFRRVRRGEFTVAASWRVSGYSKTDRVIACTRELKPDGFGRPVALDRTCGAKTLPNA